MSFDNDEPVEVFFDAIEETPSTKATLFILEEEESDGSGKRQGWIPNSVIVERGTNSIWTEAWFAEREELV